MSQVLRMGAIAVVLALLSALAGAVLPGVLVREQSGLTSFGRTRWVPDVAGFGGLSGLAMDAQGARVWAVSDRGTLFTAPVTRDAGGRISGFGPVTPHVLRDTKGSAPREFLMNAEGMVLDGAEGVFVAYEGWARVWHYPQLDGLPVWTHAWDRFWDALGNTGFEALARDASGRLLVISERVEEDSTAFPVFAYDGTGWQRAFAIPQQDDFRVSGAAFGPDGALYILERRFRWYQGFATRIRRLVLAGDAITSDQRLIDSPPWRLGNSEGISVWSDPAGRTIISVVSDDNFNWVQKTAITEFVVE